MKKFALLFIQALLPALLLAAPEGDVTGEQSQDPRLMPVETAPSESSLKTAWLKSRDEDAAKEADRLIESIRSADRDTVDLPEAGFTVLDPNPELEKLLNRGGKNLNDPEYLLSDLKNGFYRQRIIESLFASSPEAAAGSFRQALKDRSSGVRLSALKALMATAGAGSIQLLTPLLYDRYAQRRDFYPLRSAARDAIDFLKLKDEIKDLTGRGKAEKYCEALKEKAGKKQQYFCELCGRELSGLVDGADAVYSAYIDLKSPAVPAAGTAATLLPQIQSDPESAAYYLLSALAALKDTRAKDDILARLADKDSSLPGFRLLLLFDPAEALISCCPPDLKPEELLELLAGSRPAGFEPLKSDPFSDEAFRGALLKKVMRSRKFSSYLDAAGYYYDLIFDRERALGWLASYDPSASGMEQPYNNNYGKIMARCLLSQGKAEEASLFDPYAPAPLFKKYVPAINVLKTVPAQSAGGRIAGEALYRAYLKLGVLPCAMQQLSALSALPGIDEAARERYWSESKRLGELQAEKLGALEPPADSGVPAQVKLVPPSAGLNYKPGEDVRVLVSLKNESAEPAYILNSSGGPLGFDAGLFSAGVAVKRLFADETAKLSGEEAAGRVIVIDPGSSWEREFVLLLAAENISEREYELIIAYDGGAPVAGFEKGWTGKLISDVLKITVKK